MSKDKFADYDSTAASNTDVGGVNIQGSAAISNGDNALRELMSHTADHFAQATISDSATPDLGANAAHYLIIAGTTTQTAYGTVKAGTLKFCEYSGARTLTHNATSFILPGAANITTAAGDTALWVSEGSGNWRCLAYQRAASAVPGIVRGTAVASTSGTTVDFSSLPAGIKRITISGKGVSTDGTSTYIVQIGDSGGVETTAYVGGISGATETVVVATAVLTSGFPIAVAAAVADVIHFSLTLINLDGNIWNVQSGNALREGAADATYNTSGAKELSATLDRIRLTTTAGHNLDAGSVNILYEL